MSEEEVLSQARCVRLEVGEEEVLYIGVDTGNMPPNKSYDYREKVKETFVKALPDNIKVIIGPKEVDFVVIAKKTAFEEKLKGTIK